MAILITP